MAVLGSPGPGDLKNRSKIRCLGSRGDWEPNLGILSWGVGGPGPGPGPWARSGLEKGSDYGLFEKCQHENLKAYASAADPYLYPAAARILLGPTCGANQSNTCLRSFPLASVFQRFWRYFGGFRACDHHEGFLSEILHQPGRTGRDGPGWTDRIWPGGGVASKSLKKKRTRDEECDQLVSKGGQKFREP